ncbi:MAG: aminotransferase class IV [Balneolaceae bacterium]
MIVYLNGSYVEQENAKISVNDRGFLFGDGIYEVIRVVEGKYVLAQEHLTRMDEGLEALGINLNSSVRQEMLTIGQELIKKNNLEKGQSSVYIQVTRGAASARSHTFPDPPISPTVYFSAGLFTPHTQLHQDGVAVITVPDVRWSRCNLKTVNLLPNTLAKQRAQDAGVNSAIMIRDGVITESPNANIFGVKDGVLYTYPATHQILNGITRRAVLKIADRLNIPVVLEPIPEHKLFDQDELFFSGTTTDIQPITVVNGKTIGSGKPGAVVRQIQEAYEKLLTTK